MAKMRIKREKNFDGGSVTFTVLETGKTLTCDVKDVPETIIGSLLVHAINAKVGDSAADPNADAMEVMTATWKQLCEGTWAARSGGDGAGKTTQLAQALVRVTGEDLEAVNAKLADMSEDQKKDLRKHEQVKAAIDAIKLENQQAAAKKSAATAKGADALKF